MLISVSPVEVLIGITAAVAVAMIWRASVRRARRIAQAARDSARLATLTGRVLTAAAVLGGVQWFVLAHPGSTVLVAVVIGLPDLLAGYVLARALTVTTVDGPARHRGGDRR